MSRSRSLRDTDNAESNGGAGAAATMNPYDTLHVETTATDDEIKKAYRKLALRYHPDRLSSQPKEAQDKAKSIFQSVSLAYSILIDPTKRKRYDTTGRIDSLASFFTDGDDATDPAAYFQDLYDSCVTPDSIAEFRAEYQGSPEERADVLAAYVKHQGDMEGVLSEIPCSTVDDEDRFAAAITEAIALGKVEPFKAFTHEDPKAKKKRKREAEREAKEAEKLAKELGLKDAKRAKVGGQDDGEEDALRQLILRNQSRRANAFETMIDRIESKYAGNGKSKSSTTAAESKSSTARARSAPKRKPKAAASDDEEDELESDGDESLGSESAGSDESGEEEWVSDEDGEGDSDEEEEEQDEVESEGDEPAEPVRRSPGKR